MAIVNAILVFGRERYGIFLDSDDVPDVDAYSDAGIEIFDFVVNVVDARIQLVAGSVVVNGNTDVCFLDLLLGVGQQLVIRYTDDHLKTCVLRIPKRLVHFFLRLHIDDASTIQLQSRVFNL